MSITKEELERKATELEAQANMLLAQLIQPLQRLTALQARAEQLRELALEIEKEETKPE